MPKEGYSKIVENILDHPNIAVKLNTAYDSSMNQEFDYLIWTGALDAFFNYRLGRLGYRTLDFKQSYGKGDVQGNAVINYCDASQPFTRITEHKHFAPWESHEDSVLYTEYSRDCEDGDIPYYPIRLVNDKALLEQYVNLAEQTESVTFVGRLATYRYLDMDVTIRSVRNSG